MIAAITVPWPGPTWDGYLIAEQRSRSVFNPDTGAWEPFGTPLQPADIERLMVRPGPPMKFASITAWPFAGHSLLWANVGDGIPGDQVVALRLTLDPKTGSFAGDPGTTPVWMDLSPAGPVQYADGSTMKPAASAPGMPPTVPGAPATP